MSESASMPNTVDPTMMKEAGDPNEDLLKSYLGNEQSHPGSSKKGRVFDYGPRQFPSANKPQTVKLKTPITSCNDQATESITYGFAHIHSFEILEAERHFRYALYQDEKCTMALWGAALSQIIFNVGDTERGLKFAKLSVLLTQYFKVNLSDLEKALQNALLKLLRNPENNEAKKIFVSTWFNLIKEYPRELELKSLGALFIWQFDQMSALGYTQSKVDQLIKEVLANEPLHPVHHERIHLLNDGKNEYQVLGSAEKIGPSFMNSAHMWHMASHVYSMVKKFYESDEQFIRAAYLDQSQQKEIMEFPHMLHNYGHNQHYWTYNLATLGQYRKSFEVAKGLLEMPLHPKHNNPSLKEGNIGIYNSPQLAGLDALIALKNYDNHHLLLEAERDGYIPSDTKKIKDQWMVLKLYYQLAWAHIKFGNIQQSTQYITLMEHLISQNPALSKSGRNLQKILDLVSKWYQGERTVEVVNAIADLNDIEKIITPNILSKFYRQAKDPQKALDILGDLHQITFADHSDYLEYAHAEASLGNKESAQWAFNKAATLSSYLDKDSENYKLGESILELLGEEIPEDWRAKRSPRELALKLPEGYTGVRHSLPQAPNFELQNGRGEKITLEQTLADSEKGVVLVFVLGGSCIRCNEQLFKLNEEKERLEFQGYKIVAITTDSQEDLNSVLDENGKSPTKYELLSNSAMDVFKKYRSYDDFESLPLHGTYVIAKNKSIRFLDRGALPFENFEHLISEIRRLEKIQKL